ncbi:pyridoxal kinase-like isoform X1 [Littorina saxatilis]|uniref:Pyridoxal kinase n=1 Tax=Littorina saxatilis TaxID=31220 RepID=A0AAN9BLG0_9CAEN
MATHTTNSDELDCRVLSIQSSVVYGYVGNKSATFPLQILGFDVSTINSVQFSNHTGYGKWKGQVLNAEDVSDLFEGLRLNNLLQFSHVLTGYIGKVSFLEKVGQTIAEMKQCNPDLMFVCDPVMGDNGKFYVPQELVPVYRDQIVPQADIVTPNQFELEQLTDMKVNSEEEAFAAIEKLHQSGTKTVVLSSSSLGSNGVLLCLASTAVNGNRQRYRLEMPKLDAIFVGTGDLFAASLLGWSHRDGELKAALEKTIATLQAVIKKTLAYAQKAAGPGNKPTSAQMELRLIQSKSIIENPSIEIRAENVPQS